MPISAGLSARPCGRLAGGSSRTLPRELRAELAHRFDEWPLGEVDLPVLLLVGSESPAWAARSVEAHANAIARSETRVLEGHGHGANLTAPELLAAELGRFFATGSDVLANPEPLSAFYAEVSSAA